MIYEEKTNQLINQATEIINAGMELVNFFINKNYLIDLNKLEPIAFDVSQKSFSFMSLFEITKIVYDKNENINDKLVSVYSALSNFGSTALLVLLSDKSGVKFYLGTRDINQPNVAKTILKKSLKGNFPGIKISEKSSPQIAQLLEEHIPDTYSNMAISSVSTVPSLRNNNKENFIQGLEKFIDAMSEENYAAVFISSPLNKMELETKKKGYEDLYSVLSQYAQMNLTYSENDSESIAKGISETFSTAVNKGISDTTGTIYNTNKNISKSRNRGSNFEMFGIGHNYGIGQAVNEGTSNGTSTGHTVTYTKTNTDGKAISDTTTVTIGTTSTIALIRQNKTVQNLLAKIDEQLERTKLPPAKSRWVISG